MNCKFCDDLMFERGVCRACLEKLGLDVPADPIRRAMPCARCNHPELIRALAREFSTRPGQYGEREATPMGVTIKPVGATGFFSGAPKGVHGPDPAQVIGILEMYICAKCGLTEWYCQNPEQIPIGAEYGTSKLTVGGEGPYR
jgi:hypothetical protein